jgi:hypothetical protein
MPAYNVTKTLRATYDEVHAQELVDLIILVDDLGCLATGMAFRLAKMGLARSRLFPSRPR